MHAAGGVRLLLRPALLLLLLQPRHQSAHAFTPAPCPLRLYHHHHCGGARAHPHTAPHARLHKAPRAAAARHGGPSRSSSAAAGTHYEPFVSLEPAGTEGTHPLTTRTLRHSLRNFRTRVAECFSAPPPVPRGSGGSGGGSGGSSAWCDLARLAAACAAEAPLLAVSAIFLVGAALCEVALPHFSSAAVNALVAAGSSGGGAEAAAAAQAFWGATRGLAAAGAAGAALTGARAVCFGLGGTRVVVRMRHALMRALLGQDVAFYDATPSGELASRLGSDCSKLGNIVAFHVNIMARQSIQVLGGVAYMFALCRPLALVATAGLAVVAWLAQAHGRFNRRMGESIQDALADANSAAQQTFALVRVSRAHAAEDRELARYDAKLTRALDMQEAHDLGYGVYRVAVKLAQVSLQIGTLVAGHSMLQAGKMTSAQLTSFVFYLAFVLGAVYDVGDQWSKIQDALGSTREVFRLLDAQPQMLVVREQQRSASFTAAAAAAAAAAATAPNGSAAPNGGAAVGPCIEFSNVTFSYPTRPGDAALRGLSLRVPGGARVALVGPSGGGKSTVLRMIGRLYDPQGGAVAIGGRDLRSFGSRELAGTVGYVPQDPELLPLSVADNISYGLRSRQAARADVERAASQAGADGFIRALPRGYDTAVGEGSVALSGGQRQRVGIARALVRRPRVLLLDEPTSALDGASEAEVQRTLERLDRACTVVTVAHRLATIQGADLIAVVAGGRVVESGTHAALLAQGGVYAGMVGRSGGGGGGAAQPLPLDAEAAQSVYEQQL